MGSPNHYKKPSQWYRAFIGFLYPAILGSIIYSVFDVFFAQPDIQHTINAYTSGGLLILIFYYDFIWTSDMDDPSEYNWRQAIADLIIIIIAFFSINVAIENTHLPSSWILSVPLLMVMKKAVAFVWEIAAEIKRPKLGKVFFAVFSILYLVVFWFSLGKVFLDLLLLLDLLCYMCWSWIEALFE